VIPRQVDKRSRLIDDRLPGHSPAHRWLAATVIFSLAIALRLPTCKESFWLDELHSAWTAWGTLAEVMPRAAAGNQTPVYFWLLWFWKQFAGDTELALRLPSVIASSLAAGIVTVGIAKHRGSLVAGCLAGLVMTVESNAIFYGTELRPFAFAMMFGALACYLATSDTLSQKQKLLGLMATVIMSGLFQPTSIGVLAWFVVAQLLWMMQHSDSAAKRLRSVPTLVMALGVVAVIASAILFAWLAGDVLYEAWQHRQQWQSMGRADSPWQLWAVWPWLSLVVLPTSLVLLSHLKRIPSEDTNQAMPWWCLGLIADWRHSFFSGRHQRPTLRLFFTVATSSHACRSSPGPPATPSPTFSPKSPPPSAIAPRW
jgi:mannosyltransferase